jgi:hypothetical protein
MPGNVFRRCVQGISESLNRVYVTVTATMARECSKQT